MARKIRRKKMGAIRPGRAFVVLLVAVGLVAAVAVSGAFALRAMSSDAASAPSRDLHVVKAQSFDVTITASGELEARRQTEIRSKLETPAAIVYVVDEGAMVKKGDLLVELASESIESQIEDETLRVEEARNNLVAAENAYDIQVSENDAALRQALLKLELAQIALDKWDKGDIVKRREELDLAIDKAKRNLERWKDKYAQSKKLYEREFLSYDELKQDEIQLLQAEADVTTAERNKWVFETFEVDQQYKKLRSDVEEAQAEVERVKQQNASRLASKEADRANRKRTLSIREDRLAKLKEQLAATKMRAPTDGLVVYATSTSERRGMVIMGSGEQIQIGATIRPNETIIVLPDTSEMVASVRVQEALAGKIRPGQPAVVRVEALPNEVFQGTVQEVSILAESGGWRDPNRREYTVKVLLDAKNEDMRLKPGMRCEAEILVAQVENALAAPVQAVFHEGKVAYVYKDLGGGRYARTPVRVGRRATGLVEIAAGLEEGDAVLLREPSPAEVVRTAFDPQVLASLYPESEQQEEQQQGASRFARSGAGSSGAADPGGPVSFVAGANAPQPTNAQRAGAQGRAMLEGLINRVKDDNPELAKELESLKSLDDQAEQFRKFREIMTRHPELMQQFRQRSGGRQQGEGRRSGQPPRGAQPDDGEPSPGAGA